MEQQKSVTAVQNASTSVPIQNPSKSTISPWYSDQDTAFINGDQDDGMRSDPRQTTVEGMIYSAHQGSGTDACNFAFHGLDDLFDDLNSDNYATGLL